MGQSGEWSSNRRYIYPGQDKICLCTSRLKVASSRTESGCDLHLEWDTQGDIESKGVMLVSYNKEAGIMSRSRGYFTDNDTLSFVERLGENCIQTKTEYNGKMFQERIELFGGFRTRQTLGWNVKTDKLILVGQYYEEKLNYEPDTK